ncbi:MAG: sugar transferase [Anaerolineae bacterium]
MDFTVINRPRVFPYRRGYRIAKRVMDIGLCLLVLPFALPLMAIIAILIYLDSPGPVLFVQRRTGKGGKRFRMYKFRTMVPNAEELKDRYAHLNELSLPDFKITNDPRITKVGTLLRKTSLDELPQLFNILKGEMSWVGPRPTSFSADTYQLWHTERLEVMPGLTGLWQVAGRSNVDFDERLKLDIEYIQQQSLWFDLQILIRTVGTVLSQKGAH